MIRRAWDGTWLRARVGTGFHFCGTCQYATRHAHYIDAIKLLYARCLMCRDWNRFV